MHEAKLEPTDHGKQPKGDGWYVLNLDEAVWRAHPTFGRFCTFEGDVRFADIGVNVQILEPGKPNCRYHRESAQEDFLVLSGECLLLVDGEERPLRAGDFVHCPPGTTHVFVGAGNGPCAIVMIGHRRKDKTLHYPVDPTAARHGASTALDTDDPRVAYSDCELPQPCDNPWPL